MTKKEKFNALISKEKTNTLVHSQERRKNRKRLRESQAIAIKVLDKLDELGWTQRKLARAMGVSPQQITKIIKGKENLTLDTQVRLQEVLDIPILATYLERKGKRSPLITFCQQHEVKVAVFSVTDYNDMISNAQMHIQPVQQNKVAYHPKVSDFQRYEKEEIWNRCL